MTDHILSTINHISRAHSHSGVAVVGDFNRLPDGPLRSYFLRQVVRGINLKCALLDKVYTNTSVVEAVVMQPTGRGVRCESVYKVDVVRSQDPNGKAVMVHALRTFSWSSFY